MGFNFKSKSMTLTEFLNNIHPDINAENSGLLDPSVGKIN